MTRHLAACLAISTLATALPAAAATNEKVYETVEAVEVSPQSGSVVFLQITGVLEGATAPTTTGYSVSPLGSCERLALLAMSKPGKFRFVVTRAGEFPVSCKLILRTP